MKKALLLLITLSALASAGASFTRYPDGTYGPGSWTTTQPTNTHYYH